ncbi:E3 ubiquitin-protein ligase-like protein [Emericellopsis cladophorae]|uniref:E3 ubiquitin-protein ligase n=1 Tax=Emericellopsis cladophorae TaxID=2686198 RepID=A0A9Q0BIR4_9HYPO|nr:E3 ubiquitin-protein ligase-like protein [Emericellopsis cladophorae]KAI6785959.1 E3 ubiquitin-protein ligase-like protein [Emericellopsis cladophorae]
MDETMSTQERQLCEILAGLPAKYRYNYDANAAHELLQALFWSLAGGKRDHFNLLFPDGRVPESLSLREAQGAVDGAEYTEAARGKRCGHIFKAGEATYACRTCGTDDTCVLCARCFESTDHEGHMVRMHISVGNSGCCDCGDDEAWKTSLFCTIHSQIETHEGKGKGKAVAEPSEEMLGSIRMTMARVLDYVCDVISCSIEQLREDKSRESVLRDEESARLLSKYYGPDAGPCEEFSLILWNDEKHTVQEVQDQVARACRKQRKDAEKDAWTTDAVGRCILKSMDDVDALLEMARIIEAIRITVTVRSARDTFREQMCGTIVEWLNDVAGCAVGNDNQILGHAVCEELMCPWRVGSRATQLSGVIDDEEEDDQNMYIGPGGLSTAHLQLLIARRVGVDARQVDFEIEVDNDEDEDDDMEDGFDLHSYAGSSEAGDEDEDGEDAMMADSREEVGDPSVNWGQPEALEEDEATMAGYPPPPPPPPGGPARTQPRERDATPSDSDTGQEPLITMVPYEKANADIPKTPGKTEKVVPKPPRYWLETPAGYTDRNYDHPAENVFQRVRLDWLLLFDLRMWKKARTDLRSLYISTVVSIPEFKRLLTLRFSSLYTTLAQLYLIGDREPDHSIINISLQMLTTPSVTAEIVERGNFMTTLFAILYTFLTTRQVGHPWDVAADAVLAFESGTVTNRRMYHFYQDLKYLFQAPHVRERIRNEPRYLMQFLDLVKLHQGIGPNLRAVVEHVEYEADSWITASLVTRQINTQARALCESFRTITPEEMPYLQRAIRFTAKTVILNSIGAERHRFKQAEVKEPVKFKTVDDFEFNGDDTKYSVVNFVVEKGHISFHHGLHYTLSWLIECARSLDATTVRDLLSFSLQDLQSKPRLMGKLSIAKRDLTPEDYLMAAFDYPLRVCAWLAQIKANMWVRNGISLRHQASTYRGIAQRDVSHQRDIFLLQTALVICDSSRVLASIIDRFGMDLWVKGLYEVKSEAQDDAQHLDVVEDMLHLLIVLLSDRTVITAPEGQVNHRQPAMRRDLIHTLCFKPLSFNEICNKVPEKYHESEDFQDLLHEIATYKPPESISDVGMFELRPEFIEEIDPYIAHYNKNQREESELAFRKKMAKHTGKTSDEIVYEPKPTPISSGLFKDLAGFTGTGTFAQIIYYCLLYPLSAQQFTPSIPSTRLEPYLQVVLHLVLLAIHEDESDENSMVDENKGSFVQIALTRPARANPPSSQREARTIVALLNLIASKEEYKSAHPKIHLVLKRLKQKRPVTFEQAFVHLGISVDRVNTASPANASAEEERERKKKAALERRAKVMAQFQEQQKSFMDNQADIDWGEDIEEDVEEHQEQGEGRKHTWKFPTGTCILCQEVADERNLYGTFTLLSESRLLRQTDFQDPDIVREALQTPCNLDRSAEDIRPFGIAHENRHMVEKLNTKGEKILAERQTVGRGFKPSQSRPGVVASGCGHMMHYRCFETYYDATSRRHTQQIARHHPEEVKKKEFVCPLCKALGNAFLPIIWKGVEESYPSHLAPESDFADWLARNLGSEQSVVSGKAPDVEERGSVSRIPSYFSALAEAIGRSMAPRDVENEDDTAESEGTMADSESDVSTPVAASGSSTLESDLKAAYRRLRTTIESNAFGARPWMGFDAVPGDLAQSDVIIEAVGYTISCAEIQQRGQEVQPGLTLLDKIPEHLLTHLRVLSETATSYLSMASKRDRGRSAHVDKNAVRQHTQLLIGRSFSSDSDESRRRIDLYEPLLSKDTFLFLTECSFGLVPAQGHDIAHILRLCYLAEIVKVILHMSQNMPTNKWFGPLQHRQTEDDAINNFAEFALAVSQFTLDVDLARCNDAGVPVANEAFMQPGLDTVEGWYIFVKKYALTFLRKCVLLMNITWGVDFSASVSANIEAEELDRLTEALRVPSFDHMCASLTLNAEAAGWPSRTISNTVQGWVKHQLLNHTGGGENKHALVSHPGIFELVGLPKTYDALVEEATKRKCPTTGKDLTDPIICLFCGELCCSQATCCMDKLTRLGGAQQHAQRCQNSVGVFLNIRKCSILYLFRTSGSFTPAPYIDKYGETDFQLRHGRQLFLSQKRYDTMIRATVLNHGVPSLISRKLEAEINNGGWDTL